MKNLRAVKEKIKGFARSAIRPVRVVLILILIPIIYEIFPRFYSVPIHSPDYEAGSYSGDWETTVHSIYEDTLFPGSLTGRIFIVRKEDVIYNQQFTPERIFKYFDSRLAMLGWLDSGPPFPYDYACEDYIPEVDRDEHGRWQYRRYTRILPLSFDTLGGSNDFACVAVWRDSPSDYYQVVFVTARMSYLELLFAILSS